MERQLSDETESVAELIEAENRNTHVPKKKKETLSHNLRITLEVHGTMFYTNKSGSRWPENIHFH